MSLNSFRVLIAIDVSGTPRILRTDSAHVAWDARTIGTTDADELGLVRAEDVGPGLYLWTGCVKARYYDESASEPEYVGVLTPVLDFVPEIAELFAMIAGIGVSAGSG